MILSGKEIVNCIVDGSIDISPFDLSKVNPNSYNLTLNDHMIEYDNGILDMKKDNSWHEVIIPEDGYLLKPGKIYLARTNEYTYSKDYVPMLEGRSSVGRLGLYIHVTAGFGDIGFKGYWTLELSCVQPIIIYPNIDICQIYYHTVYDRAGVESCLRYEGKYSNNNGIQTSQLWRDFLKGE